MCFCNSTGTVYKKTCKLYNKTEIHSLLRDYMVEASKHLYTWSLAAVKSNLLKLCEMKAKQETNPVSPSSQLPVPHCFDI